jgi:hypothetical protein
MGPVGYREEVKGMKKVVKVVIVKKSCATCGSFK